MATRVILTIGEARAVANAWLIDYMPDRFAAGIPEYDSVQQGWRIPVWLAYPDHTPLGPVGELLVDAVSGAVRAFTPLAEMKTRALQLYDQHRATIDAPLP